MLNVDKASMADEVFAGKERHLLDKVFEEAGIPESRWADLKEGLLKLHSAFSKMESHTQGKFFRIFKADFSKRQAVRDGLFAVLTMTGIAEDLRWEFEEDYYAGL